MTSLDYYIGHNDDERLDKAFAAAAGTRLDLFLPPRPLTFARKGRPLFKGRIQGSGRLGEVTLDFDSQDGVGWFHHDSSSLAKQSHFRDLTLRSDSAPTGKHPAFLTQDKDSPGFQQLVLHSIQASGLWGVVGCTSQRLLLTACTFSGPDWDLNNGWQTAVYIGGSDNVFWNDGIYLDSPGVPDRNGHDPISATPHLRVGYMDKSQFGRIYCTATGRWYALLFEGQAYNSGSTGGNGGPVSFNSPSFEGRSKTTPCYGPVVRVAGGQPVFHAPWFGYGMSQPQPGDLGVVQCTGGYTRAHSPTYGNASGVSPDVPFLHATGDGTQVRITDGSIGSQAGKWPNPRPRYRTVNKAAVRADVTFVKVT